MQEIAREKAGIFKPGVQAFSVPQPGDALQALQEKADAVTAPLRIVDDLNTYR
jgi:folylpolyglutamate synthase/dihydropteroate synthase